MAVEVRLPGSSKPDRLSQGEKFSVDDRGGLRVVDANGKQLATYEPSQWLNAKVVD